MPAPVFREPSEPQESLRRTPTLGMLLIALILLLSRWGAVRTPTELNPDESQLMAQAMRLNVDGLPWRGMDGTTGGPLNSWFLFLSHAAGLPLGYPAVHALAACMLAMLCGLTFASVWLGTSRGGVALAAGGAAALTLALAQGPNFVHFSSELLPATVEMLVVCLLLARARTGRESRVLEVCAAVLVGLLPWTKLQAVLGAFVLAGWILWTPAAGQRASGRVPPRRALLLLALVAPSVAILVPVWRGGAFPDFWASYVRGNGSYLAAPTLRSLAGRVIRLFASPPSRLLAGSGIFASTWLLLARPGWRALTTGEQRSVLWVGCFIGATLVSLLLPSEPFQHYHVFLIAPLALASGLLLGAWRRAGETAAAGRGAWLAFLLGLIVVPATNLPRAIQDVRARSILSAHASETPQARVADRIRQVAPEAHGLVVWGWMPGLHVESGLVPFTRHAVGHFVIEPGPSREHLRRSFLQDVRRERPDIFVDAVADGCFKWRWGTSQRLESFPELDRFVRENYHLVSELSLAAGNDPVRIYRWDRSRPH